MTLLPSAARRALLLFAAALHVTCAAGDPVLGETPGAEGRLVERRAVVVGINDYTASRLPRPPGFVPGHREIPDLRGAVNDARAVAEALTGRFGFAPGAVRLLLDQEATGDAIVQAVESHLLTAGEGDHLVFFFAGHGSTARNRASSEPDRLDETLVPADAALGRLDLRDKELRRLFNRALDRGARLTVILDSCHSGSGYRAEDGSGRVRAAESDPRILDVADPDGPRPEDRGALVMAAAQDFQYSWETPDRQHGAFTLALMRAIRGAAPGEPAERVFARARAWLPSLGTTQEPVLAGDPRARSAPLFGEPPGTAAGGLAIAVERVEEGEIVLQAGWLHGLAPGSELAGLAGSEGGEPVRLEVTSLQGLTRSRAVARGEGRPPAVGDLFRLEGWMALPASPLAVWISESGDEQWLRTRRGAAVEDGAEAGSGIPASLVAALGLEGSASSLRVRRVGTPEEAVYRLAVRRPGEGAGETAGEAAELAWVRTAGEGGVPSPGLPPRSRWIRLDSLQPEAVERAARQLEQDLAGLTRIHAWLDLESPPATDFPYRLALRSTAGRSTTGGELRGGERYALVLQAVDGAPDPSVERRYVYAFSLDAFGRCSLLYPRPGQGNTENRFPAAGRPAAEVVLGTDPLFEVAPPWGMDVHLLLTTAEPLAQPEVLECGGVRDGAAVSPLDELLAATGTGQRGSLQLPTPVSWSLERLVFRSVEAAR